MAITLKKIEAALVEAQRFVDSCEKLRERMTKNRYKFCDYLPKETGDVRRKSMDLTRSLADLRRA